MWIWVIIWNCQINLDRNSVQRRHVCIVFDSFLKCHSLPSFTKSVFVCFTKGFHKQAFVFWLSKESKGAVVEPLCGWCDGVGVGLPRTQAGRRECSSQWSLRVTNRQRLMGWNCWGTGWSEGAIPLCFGVGDNVNWLPGPLSALQR